MLTFSAIIYKIGINPVVDPPDDVLHILFEQAGRSKGPIPVRGTLNGVEFPQTLVKYGGVSRLYINRPMLKSSGLSVGDKADVEISFDSLPRDTPIPPKFAAALECDQLARSAFETLTPSRRKEILKYMGFLKTAESLERNIAKVIKQLSQDRER
jgi:Bacteriocin-protection, YdeI or OmpD-Associated/Domain of unknown function (DUF1905)